MEPHTWTDHRFLYIGAALVGLVLATGAVSVVCCGLSRRALRQTAVGLLAWVGLVVLNLGVFEHTIADPIVLERFKGIAFFATLFAVTLYVLGPVRERWFPRDVAAGPISTWQLPLEWGLVALLLAPLIRHLTDVHPRPMDFLPFAVGVLLVARSLLLRRRTRFGLPQMAIAGAALALELILPVLYGSNEVVAPALVATGGLMGAFLGSSVSAAVTMGAWLLLVAASATIDPRIVSPVSRTLLLGGVGCILYGLFVAQTPRRVA